MGPQPGHLQPLAALSELQATPAYDATPSARLEPLNLSRLSLPPPGSSPVALKRLLGSDGDDLVRRFLVETGLPKDEALRRTKAAGFKKPYLDPSLRDPRRDAEFVRRLVDAGVADLTANRDDIFDKIGLFAVAKKSGRQRLVLDARPANFHFTDPSPVRLATGTALVFLELGMGDKLWTASADIADAFYNMEMPAAWRGSFALPPLSAGRRGIELLGGLPLSRDTVVWPRMAVLPTGWSHALFFCQRVCERTATLAGLGAESRLVDRKEAPPATEGAHAWTTLLP